jgi:poly(3-hydroxybutyrate) depolymerase
MPRRRAGLAVLLTCAALLAPAAARSAERLKSFGADLSQTTVSGLSSGAFMAHQFHVAFSGIVRGAGIVAGGPYYCAQNQIVLALKQCMQTYMGAPDPARLLRIARDYAEQQRIDPLDNLKDQRVYIYSGTSDNTVAATVVDAARRFYLLAGVPADSIEYRHDVPSGHAMITDDFGSSCSATRAPYIDNCNYDQAGAILKRLYPDLKPRAGEAPGKIVMFDQTEFFPAGSGGGLFPLPGPGGGTLSLNDSGYLYVPTACADTQGCRVHVVFHGCKQTPEDIQDTYVRHAGYNRWAETNNIIVLYPQAKHASANPEGCWDWWGYSGPDYVTKTGPQMAAVRAMLDRLAAR